MVHSTSSINGESQSRKSPSHVDSVCRNSPSVFTISDENPDEKYDINHDSSKKIPNPSSMINKIPLPSSVPRTPTVLPPIGTQREKHLLNRESWETTKDTTTPDFTQKSTDGDDLDRDAELEVLEADKNVRKMSCCYGLGVFIALFSGLAALTALVIYAGFWYLLQQEGKA